MLKGKTKSGYEYEVDEKALDDYELMEALADIETNPLKITKVVNLLFGESKAGLIEFLKSKNGYASTTEIGNIVTEVFDDIKNGKKS